MTGPSTLSGLLDAVLAAGPACGPDTAELFTGGRGWETFDQRLRREQRAKAVCVTCPALWQCLSYSLALDPVEGVWAGLSQDDRDGIRAQAAA
ncbi:WhiB family transcriptional regulator [Nonomuraea longicatena]|uniref:4Fe-4S Wbl-type domain-containing protein n=1 Tax=Nonomuraea longicatena TaxID=83682 RepID=A0ABP4BGA7_9ACTN